MMISGGGSGSGSGIAPSSTFMNFASLLLSPWLVSLLLHVILRPCL
jgi:hypothetical protein